jgi:hypothetical protein
MITCLYLKIIKIDSFRNFEDSDSYKTVNNFYFNSTFVTAFASVSIAISKPNWPLIVPPQNWVSTPKMVFVDSNKITHKQTITDLEPKSSDIEEKDKNSLYPNVDVTNIRYCDISRGGFFANKNNLTSGIKIYSSAGFGNISSSTLNFINYVQNVRFEYNKPMMRFLLEPSN